VRHLPVSPLWAVLTKSYAQKEREEGNDALSSELRRALDANRFSAKVEKIVCIEDAMQKHAKNI